MADNASFCNQYFFFVEKAKLMFQKAILNIQFCLHWLSKKARTSSRVRSTKKRIRLKLINKKILENLYYAKPICALIMSTYLSYCATKKFPAIGLPRLCCFANFTMGNLVRPFSVLKQEKIGPFYVYLSNMLLRTKDVT